MKKLFVKFALLFMLSTNLHAQKIYKGVIDYMTDPRDKKEIGKGDVVTEVRALKGEINEVVVGNGMQLILTNDTGSSFNIVAQENLLPLVTSIISENKLTFKLSASLLTTSGINIYVPLGAINKVLIKEGAYFEADSSLTMSNFNLTLESGSVGYCGLNLGQFTCLVNSGSNLTLEGIAGNSDIFVKGGSIMDGLNFASQDCKVRVLGASECSLKVENALVASVENESNLYYTGHPKKVRKSTDLNGQIHEK